LVLKIEKFKDSRRDRTISKTFMKEKIKILITTLKIKKVVLIEHTTEREHRGAEEEEEEIKAIIRIIETIGTSKGIKKIFI